MWTLDLRWAVVGLAMAALLLFGLGRWSARGRARRDRLPMDRAPLGFLRLDAAGGYADANPLACQHLGLDRPAGRLPEAEWRPWLMEDLEAARAEGIGRTRWITLRGGRALRWWVAPTERGALLFVADAEESYRWIYAMRRLLWGLAHELRTPLATILTHLEVLKLPATTPEVRAQSMQILEEETRRMLRMVHNVLDLGRLASEPPVLGPVDLPTVVRAAVAEKMPEAEARGQTLSVEIEEGLPKVHGDADRLRQVFLNLLDNAIRYSRPGDRITVTLRRAPGGIQCAVADTGPGIPEVHLPYITEPFYRGEAPDSGGSGLGLTIVAEILRLHGARLEIESRTAGETGTCVRFTLPAWEADG